ncbi:MULTISPECIES: sugar nucleotide-binding protein [Klebsiella/Raoultella group]|nr:hypothetical protein [Klebsiella pneumoniae]MBC4928422.1 sugar nucleotide-binding protein [Klebsiella quasipneumoniae]PQH13201.1 hypothetical protein C5T92_20165 [Raoultella ornithinolytica]QER53675.1 sugar nucleotide-binding protein [Klebsiella quasipneumoniae subsp. quasipneumoniae]EIW8500584.1 hypothetical protein [Klebsiella pneumoniae]
MNARLVNVSTDYVFNGILPRPYSELEQTEPLGVNGK